MRELFIYFKTHTEHEAQVRSHLHGMQRALRQAHPQLVTRLLMRPEASHGLHTWMEIYSGMPELGSGSRVDEAISQVADGLAPFMVGARKIEVFAVCEDG